MAHSVTDSIFPCILAADGDLCVSAAPPVAQASLRLHQLPALSLRHLAETGVGGDAAEPQKFLVTPLHRMTPDRRGSARLRSSCEMDGSATGSAPTRRPRLCTFVQGDDARDAAAVTACSKTPGKPALPPALVQRIAPARCTEMSPKHASERVTFMENLSARMHDRALERGRRPRATSSASPWETTLNKNMLCTARSAEFAGCGGAKGVTGPDHHGSRWPKPPASDCAAHALLAYRRRVAPQPISRVMPREADAVAVGAAAHSVACLAATAYEVVPNAASVAHPALS